MALNEFMSRQVRRKQKPEFNPGSASVLPPPPTAPAPTPPSPTSYTYFNYTHVVAITFHFVLLSLHTLLHLHHHLRPVHLHCLPACCCLLPMVMVPKTTPGQPRQFYAHTMEKVQPFKSQPSPAQPSPTQLSPRPSHDSPPKTTNFRGKMFGLIGFGSGYIEWFLPGLLYAMLAPHVSLEMLFQ